LTIALGRPCDIVPAGREPDDKVAGALAAEPPAEPSRMSRLIREWKEIISGAGHALSLEHPGLSPPGSANSPARTEPADDAIRVLGAPLPQNVLRRVLTPEVGACEMSQFTGKQSLAGTIGCSRRKLFQPSQHP
jgi:hypothetical protein